MRPAWICLPSQLNSPFAPVDSWINPAILRLYSLGFVDTVYLGMRPWTRSSIDHMLEQASARIEGAEDGLTTDEAQGIFHSTFQPNECKNKVLLFIVTNGRKVLTEMHVDSRRENSVKRRTLLYGLGALAGNSLLAGCGFRLTGNNTVPTSNLPIQPAPIGTLTPGNVEVSGSAGASIGAAFTGLSYEKGAFSSQPLFTGSNTNMIGMFKGLGTSVLRIGGGSVDRTVWRAEGKGQTVGQVAPPDIDALAAFLQATGWQCLYGINLAGKTTPALAAAEAAYAVKALGSSLYGIELGNECDWYGWPISKFEVMWEQFRTAILGASPDVVFTGPAAGGDIPNWTVPFGEYATNQQIGLLTQHYYRESGANASATAAELVSANPWLETDCGELQTAARNIGIPWRMSETNSFSDGGSNGASNSYASSLWVIDHLATIALNGGAGVNMHGGSGSIYTPISDNDGVVVGARPVYYGMLMFNLLGQGQMLNTTVNTGGLNVTAYTVKPPTGGLNLLIVNKDSTQNVQPNIHCGQIVHQASLLQMTGPNLGATTGIMIQGATVNLDGSFTPGTAYSAPHIIGESVTCYVPALSAVLLQVS